MKKIIALALLLILSATSFSQPVTNPAPTVKTDYLQKSKHQKTAAWICLGGGGALFITGLAIFPIGWSPDIFSGGTLEDGRRATASIGLMLTGVTSMLVSISKFKAASRNKRKGLSLSFKNEMTPQIQKSSFVNSAVPSVSLKLSL